MTEVTAAVDERALAGEMKRVAEVVSSLPSEAATVERAMRPRVERHVKETRKPERSFTSVYRSVLPQAIEDVERSDEARAAAQRLAEDYRSRGGGRGEGREDAEPEAALAFAVAVVVMMIALWLVMQSLREN